MKRRHNFVRKISYDVHDACVLPQLVFAYFSMDFKYIGIKRM